MTHQNINDKYFIFYFDSNMINNKFKG